jgi:UDP-N-acetylglucosamine/UDP-N-acetylgalactosamine diphosphorylase
MIHPRHTFEDHGQGQVFRFFDGLSPAQQDELTRQAAAIDLDELDRLVQDLVRAPEKEHPAIGDGLAPAEFTPLPEHGGDPGLWARAAEAGEEALRAGRVAAFTVAGGQGTRLGYDGPKGAFPVTPVLKKSLFQVFAEKIRAAEIRFGKPIPWFIMTSVINHEATERFFKANRHFGLDPDRVFLFRQGLMPAVDGDGKILLAGPGEISLSPDGHGGSLRALVRSGAVDRMEAAGVDVLSYFQVDNPMVRCIDPAFIGFHLMGGSEMSCKALPKAYPEEKIGVFCRDGDGRRLVIEYSDLPERLMHERDESGELRFRGGSIAIHVFDREFVRRMGSGGDPAAVQPFHLARKKVPFVDAAGNRVEPAEANAWKFEMFVFDALPFAKHPVIVETSRQDDFSPVKNAEGTDSAVSCRDDQLRQFARWVKAAGVNLETDESGLPPFAFEISPLFADTGERFVEKWKSLPVVPGIGEGTVIV